MTAPDRALTDELQELIRAHKDALLAAMAHTGTTEHLPRKALPLVIKSTDTAEDAARKFSQLVTSAELAAYRTINAAEGKSSIGEQIDVPTVLETLREQAAAVNRGDQSQAEAILMNQATALQSLAARLSERAMSAEYLPQFDSYMRLALKAQSQCRATLETLATIKNPPIVYARQANVTTGPQQVNNGVAPSSRAREIEREQTQLSGSREALRSVVDGSLTASTTCANVRSREKV